MRFDLRAQLVLATLMAAGAAAAAPVNDKVSAYRPEDDPSAQSRNLADREDASTQYRTGLMVERGRGAKQDYAEVRRRYLKAAAEDDPLAEFSLGVLSARGLGAPKDYVEAVKWFRRAADRGVAAAQFNLGVMYAHALGVPQDYVLAHMWFSLAAAQGEEGAKEALDDTAAKMTPAEIGLAQNLAKTLEPLAWNLRL
jgi:TPR repeat protein